MKNLSTSQPLNLSTVAASAFAVAVLAATAKADSATDSAIRMEEVGIAVFGHSAFEEPTAAYPTAASGTCADEANASAPALWLTAEWQATAEEHSVAAQVP